MNEPFSDNPVAIRNNTKYIYYSSGCAWIRLSEPDVKSVQGSAAGKLTAELVGYQATIYNFRVNSYFKYIPKPQQAGIIMLGINDRNS